MASRTLLTVLIGLLVWLALCCAPLTGLYVESNRRAASEDLRAVGLNTLSGMKSTMDSTLAPVVAAARLVETLTPEVFDCTLAEGFASSGVLATILTTYTYDVSSPHLQGVGVMTFVGAEGGAPDFSNKISYELTNGTIVKPACPEYLYGYTDNGTNYTSVCANLTGAVTQPAEVRYSGPDYGATSLERALMTGEAGAAIFTPVFDLVGRQSISYERAKPACGSTSGGGAPNNIYAISFAQTNLVLLSNQLALFGIDGAAFVVERASGLLAACSVPDQTVRVDPATGGEERVAAVNASNALVREAGRLLAANLDSLYPLAALQAEGLVVFAQPYEYADAGAALGWINVVVLRKQDYVTVLYHGRNAALYAVLIVVTFILAMLVTGVLVWLGGRSKSALSSSASQQPLSGGDVN